MNSYCHLISLKPQFTYATPPSILNEANDDQLLELKLLSIFQNLAPSQIHNSQGNPIDYC